MRDSIPFGSWASGPPGDPELDAMLPGAIAESMLSGGQAGTMPTELRPLGETLAALRAAPSTAEFRGEQAVLAAFRSVSGAARVEWSGGVAHTLPLEIPLGARGRRPRRARHAARGRARLSHRSPTRSSAGRRLALGTAAAVALVVIMGVIAYSGHLPEPIQSAAHEVIGAPKAGHQATARRNTPVTGGGSLNGSSATPAAHAKPTAVPSGDASAPAPKAGPKQWCEAYFKNPWRPGSTSWDKSDFIKLSRAANGPWWVLRYCAPYLNGPSWLGDHGFRLPAGYDGGPWAWTPSGQGPGHDIDTGPGSGGPGTGGAPGTGPLPGEAPRPG